MTPAGEGRMQALSLEFLARFYAAETARHPHNVDALAELGHVYTQQGRYPEGLAVDRRLVRLVPENPTVHYNLACSLALVERPDEALDALEAAVERGYDDVQQLLADGDLTSLREEPRFRELVSRLEGQGAL